MVSKGAKAVLYSIAIGATLLAVLSIVGVIALGMNSHASWAGRV